jgi:isopenicillin-N epimerase
MQFGRGLLEQFPLEPGGIYLNHGTVGVTPLAVMRARAAILEEIERHPARYMIRELMQLGMSAPPEVPRLRAAAGRVAEFVGVRAEDLVFVDNASSGVNAVLRAIELEPGDEILLTGPAYGGVARAAAFIARRRGATVTTVALPFPPHDPESYVCALAAAITPRTRLAVLDHVSSETALVMPLAAMAAACRARGVPVLVDGAHAPGQVALDIARLEVDWYAANLHKWCFAPRSCGILWAAPERQAALHPGVISWGITNDDWLQEFEWTGTRDPSPWLAAPAGLDFMHEVLGVAAMRAWNHDLAWRSALRLGERWGTPWTTPEAMVGCMVTVPLPARLGPGSVDNAQRLRDALFFNHRIEAPVIARGGALWARLSMQVYNEDEDVERFAAAVEALRAG